jgi:hypothetical protein
LGAGAGGIFMFRFRRKPVGLSCLAGQPADIGFGVLEAHIYHGPGTTAPAVIGGPVSETAAIGEASIPLFEGDLELADGKSTRNTYRHLQLVEKILHLWIVQVGRPTHDETARRHDGHCRAEGTRRAIGKRIPKGLTGARYDRMGWIVARRRRPHMTAIAAMAKSAPRGRKSARMATALAR